MVGWKAWVSVVAGFHVNHNCPLRSVDAVKRNKGVLCKRSISGTGQVSTGRKGTRQAYLPNHQSEFRALQSLHLNMSGGAVIQVIELPTAGAVVCENRDPSGDH